MQAGPSAVAGRGGDAGVGGLDSSRSTMIPVDAVLGLMCLAAQGAAEARLQLAFWALDR
jgi:hypothetical protein